MTVLENKRNLREKRKINLSLSTLQSQVGGRILLPKFLFSELDGGKWLASLTSKKKLNFVAKFGNGADQDSYTLLLSTGK